jgi:Spy/CpxP family protein refolding chaperone
MTQQTENKPKRFSRKFWVISSLVLAIVVGGAGLGVAQKVKQFRGHGPLGFMLNKMVDELNLTEQQKSEVEKIKAEIKAKIESRRQTREDRFAEFEKLFLSDKIDKAALEELHQKHEADREEMRSFFQEELIKFHSILTPSQRTKAVEIMKEKKEKMKKHFEGDGIPPDNN